jgi:hypothetical protein
MLYFCYSYRTVFYSSWCTKAVSYIEWYYTLCFPGTLDVRGELLETPQDIIIIIIIIIIGVRLSPFRTAATTGLFYQPQMIDDGDRGATGGMKIGRGNRNTRKKSASKPLCPPQITHDQTRAAAVGKQRLTAWAMARPVTPQDNVSTGNSVMNIELFETYSVYT